jgi:Na+-translocating ferredoxin:NAD+ oxidoreductase RnfD subunit
MADTRDVEVPELNAATLFEPEGWSWLVRFGKTPKGLLLGILIVFVVIAAPFAGIGLILPNLIACVATAALLDLAIESTLHDRRRFPDGAILTGLIVALVLRPQEPLSVAVAISSIAILSKHALRTPWSNVFNPAAVALVVGAIVFQAGQSWWGALPDTTLLGLGAVGAAGLFIADRINKLPLVAVFLGTYFGLFTIDSFIGEPMAVSEIFRTPDLQAALFFAFFMLDDPPTCPIRYEDQVLFGIIVAVAGFAIFKLLGVDYYLAGGLLAGNAWESSRRVWVHRGAQMSRQRNQQSIRATAPSAAPGARR